MILTYAGVPFEDVRITMDEWPKWKPSRLLIQSNLARYKSCSRAEEIGTSIERVPISRFDLCILATMLRNASTNFACTACGRETYFTKRCDRFFPWSSVWPGRKE